MDYTNKIFANIAKDMSEQKDIAVVRAFVFQITELLQENGIMPICTERYMSINSDKSSYSIIKKSISHSMSLIVPSTTEKLENRHTEILSRNLRAELIQKIYLKNSLKLNVYYWSVIRMGLIDADTLKKDLESVTLSNGTLVNTNAVLLLLDKYPTAYDVDKVVEQLEELKSQVPVNRILDDIIKDKPKELGQLIAYGKAIEIVKAGGNIELSEHSKSQGNRTGKQKATIEAKLKTE